MKEAYRRMWAKLRRIMYENAASANIEADAYMNVTRLMLEIERDTLPDLHDYDKDRSK